MLETCLLSVNRWLPCQGSKHHINFKSYSHEYSLILEETFQILTRFLIDSFKTRGLQISFDNVQSISRVHVYLLCSSLPKFCTLDLSHGNIELFIWLLFYFRYIRPVKINKLSGPTRTRISFIRHVGAEAEIVMRKIWSQTKWEESAYI